MPTKLIQLEEGVLIEVEASPTEAQPISGALADRVGASMESVQSSLVKLCQPILGAWRFLAEEGQVEQAEIEFGVALEGEGNLFVTRTKASATLKVKLILKSSR